MQKKFIFTYFLIVLTLIVMMSVSRHGSDKIRGQFISFLAPLWQKVLLIKHSIVHPSEPSPFTHLSLEEEKQRLQLENQLLEIEVAYLQEQLQEQLLVSSQMTQIAPYLPEETKTLAEEYEKSLKNTLKTIKNRIHAVPSRVIFRSFDTWNSSLWINVGESTNRNLQQGVIVKNSPVVIGKAVVGIIDHVEENQSRVRLISDSRLRPSVRAARGGEEDFLIGEQIEKILYQLHYKKTLSLGLEEQNRLVQLLQKVKQNLQPFNRTWYLAKGELLGSLFSSRLGQPVYLKGVGFNYDFSDEEGESRDLRTGKASRQGAGGSLSILKMNDVLVTTGMDGIFPPGFDVAIVTSVGVLKEGDYYYDVEARPVAGPLEELSLLFVLPPIVNEGCRL
ncbi:MAG: rod shape-determining protein MreC [Parachlamydiaceae bacterium]